MPRHNHSLILPILIGPLAFFGNILAFLGMKELLRSSNDDAQVGGVVFLVVTMLFAMSATAELAWYKERSGWWALWCLNFATGPLAFAVLLLIPRPRRYRLLNDGVDQGVYSRRQLVRGLRKGIIQPTDQVQIVANGRVVLIRDFLSSEAT